MDKKFWSKDAVTKHWTVSYDTPAQREERQKLYGEVVCEICEHYFKEIVRGNTGPLAMICPACLRIAENLAGEARLTLFAVIDQMKKHAAERIREAAEQKIAEAPPVSPSSSAAPIAFAQKFERLPCVCCGDNLVIVTLDGIQTYVVNEGGPMFVCKKCDDAATVVADSVEGPIATDDDYAGGVTNTLHAVDHARKKFEVLAQMALLGYLGKSQAGEE